MTKDQLKAMPTYRYSDARRRGTVYPYRQDLTANPYLAAMDREGPVNLQAATIDVTNDPKAARKAEIAESMKGFNAANGPAKSLERIAALKLQAAPGERFTYSDVNFIVLEALPNALGPTFWKSAVTLSFFWLTKNPSWWQT